MATRPVRKIDGYLKKLQQWIEEAVDTIKRKVMNLSVKSSPKTGTPLKMNNPALTDKTRGLKVMLTVGKGTKGMMRRMAKKTMATVAVRTAAPIRIATGQVMDDSTDLSYPVYRLASLPKASCASVWRLIGATGTATDVHLRVADDSFWYIDEDHSEIQFMTLHLVNHHAIHSIRKNGFVASTATTLPVNSAGERYYFTYALGQRLPLSALVDRNGNH